MRGQGVRIRVGALLAAAVALAAPPPAAARAAAERADEVAPAGDVRVEVLKGERALLLWSGGDLVERYTIGLGFRPAGDKVRQGDGRTPEGDYAICIKNPWSRYYLSVGLDYPNADDADRALASGLIDEGDHLRIVRALARGECPPWDTALGGEIFIHGRGSGADWTLGCVALDDPDMKRLYEAVRIGTPVAIRP